MSRTYEIGTASTGRRFIKCLRCNRTSYNENDVENKFCPNPKCGFHQDDQISFDEEDRGHDPYDHDPF